LFVFYIFFLTDIHLTYLSSPSFSCSDVKNKNKRCGLEKDNIWIPVVLRFLLIPCLVFCVQGYIVSDLASILIVLLMGFTNGYLGTLAILLVNDCVDSEEERASAGMITGLILNSGLVLGSTAALGFQAMVGSSLT
jgi:solute carrier family 29 (equilibrative nucleoside transporter), member 1/2/3